MKILCVFGKYNYGDPARGYGYEYANFLPALQQLGEQIEFFDSQDRQSYSDFAALNLALLQKTADFCPDLVFCVLMNYEIWTETLQIIRNTGVKLLNWGTDDSWKYAQFSRYMAKYFDVWITTSKLAWQQSQQDGLDNFMLSQWAASQKILAEPLPAKQCRFQVSCVGSAYGNRPRWITDLARQGITVYCFGYGWPSGSVEAEEIPKIVRESVISLNFGDSGLHFHGLIPFRSRQIKARVFEVPGAGGCLLTETAENLQDYYLPDQQIKTFETVDDLVAKITFLLNNPTERDTLALAGYHRTIAEHTYLNRFKSILERFSAIPHYQPIDFTAFQTLEAAYRLNFADKLMKKILVWPFALIFGKQRGKRAARRLLFELSWRILGGKVYSASGWPGRWFYQES